MEFQMIEAFRRIPYGIYVLAVKQGPDRSAMVVSWVSQVSYSPPLLMVALRRNRKALPAIRESGSFSLGLLRKDQKPSVSRFKESPPEPPSSFLKRCLASWECRLISTREAGDHILCIGEVKSAFAEGEGDPLTTLDYGNTYIGQF